MEWDWMIWSEDNWGGMMCKDMGIRSNEMDWHGMIWNGMKFNDLEVNGTRGFSEIECDGMESEWNEMKLKNMSWKYYQTGFPEIEWDGISWNKIK